MSKQFMWKASACACAIMLSACGGHKAYQNMPIISGTSSTGTSAASTTSSSTSSTAATPRTFAGVAIKMTGNVQTKQFTPPLTQLNLSGSALNSVTVDGHNVTLLEAAAVTNSSNKGQVIYDADSYMRFGTHFIRENDKLSSYIIAYGQLTPESSVPTVGSASYKGNSVYRRNSSSNDIYGVSEFAVNYATKQISGSVDRRYPLNGTITGNSFSGTHTNGLHMQGRFFGPNADELSGTFHNPQNPNDAAGAFGGRKQAQ